ncbi:MAG: hypothetical protein GXY10_04615 [Clostridiales bacterium]|nr:hypothetical protein [Clostridiales bacterium]
MKVGKMYEEVINDLYGIPLPAKKAALSVQLTKTFLAVANDPTGKLRPFVDKIEDKYASKKKFTALMRPPEGYGKVDYLNFNHREWRVARNRDQITDLDFMELIDTAINSATTVYIPMLYSSIKDGTEMDKSLFRVNYEGVDIEYIEEQIEGRPSPMLPVYVRKEEKQPEKEENLPEMSEQPSEDGTVGIEDVSTTQEQPLEDGIGGSELGIEDVITTKEQPLEDGIESLEVQSDSDEKELSVDQEKKDV